MLTAQEKSEEKPIALVTGGAGFVGSFLCEALLLQGCRVICLDNFSTGKKENLAKCFSNADFTFFRHDLSKSLPKEIERVDYVFHLVGIDKGIKNLFHLAQKNQAKLLLISSQRLFHMSLSTKNLREINARVVQLIDVYGPRMNLGANTAVANLFCQALTGGPLKLPGDGSAKVYPTFVADVIWGLVKAMFTPNTTAKIFSLVNQKGITLLELATHLQKRVSWELKVEFISQKEAEGNQIWAEIRAGQKELDWQPKVNLAEGTKETLQYFETKKAKRKPKKKSKKKSKKRLVGFLLFLAVLFYPLASLFLYIFLGVSNLKKIEQMVPRGDFSQITSRARTAQTNFQKALKQSERVGPLFVFLGQQSGVAKAKKLFFLGEQLSGSLVDLGLASEEIVSLIKTVFQKEPAVIGDQVESIEESLTKIKVELDDSFYRLSSVEAELKTDNSINQALSQRITLLPSLRELVLAGKELLPVVPDLIGLYQKRTYLVLLQNNNELRPTGGFIGSFGLLTFSEGRLADFEIKDVYSADGQLKGHVEPPLALKKHLGEAGWYLRDSNWNPDFPTSARRASWFLNKETGRLVDGILGVNLFTTKNLVAALGEVKVVDFEEKITADNLFERAEYYSEANFFPGSTQKEAFLGALSRALFLRLKEADQKTWFNLAKALYHSLQTKDLLVFFETNPAAAQVMANLGWNGQISEIKCQTAAKNETEDCLADYLMVVEANVGVNKANYFVKRELTHQVNVAADGEINEVLSIYYRNDSPSDSFPGGRYKNYLRVLVPAGTKLGKVLINQQILEEEKIEVEQLVGRTAFGFLVEVPIQEDKMITVFYQLAKKLSLMETSQYLLFLQKQSGIEDKAFNLWLNLPQDIVLSAAQPEATAGTEGYLFNFEFNQDLVLEATLIK